MYDSNMNFKKCEFCGTIYNKDTVRLCPICKEIEKIMLFDELTYKEAKEKYFNKKQRKKCERQIQKLNQKL